MGVSFKVSRTGTRYRPKLLQIEGDRDPPEIGYSVNEEYQAGKRKKIDAQGNELLESTVHSISRDPEVSFSLNLFQDGFSIGRASKFFNDVPPQLLPYDRASKELFTAIEYGWLPGDLLDDIPCKYFNGSLLCEIRDYRISFSQRKGSPCMRQRYPTVHKVLLQMSMENVLKDILSISDPSWTYGDFLEVESRILKALQPDLQLNPEPLLEMFPGGSSTKRINLGISWSCKKRKLNGLLAADLESSRQNYKSHNEGNCAMLISNPQSSLPCQSGGVPCVQKTLNSSVNMQRNNAREDSALQSYFSLLQQSIEPTDCYRSNPTTVSTSLSISAPQKHHSIIDPNTFHSPVFGKRSETQASLRFTSMDPENVSLDFSKSQLVRREVEAVQVSELPWKTNISLQIEADKVMSKRFPVTDSCLALVSTVQHAIREGNPESQRGMPVNVKQEPVEISDSYVSYNRTNLRKNFLMDPRNNHSQQLSSLIRANGPKMNLTPTVQNFMPASMDKLVKNASVARKRKASWTSQVTGSKSATGHSQLELPAVSPLPERCKNNTQMKGISMELLNFLASTGCTSNLNGSSKCTLPLGNLNLVQGSELSVDPLIDRFLKIESVTQRYGLSDMKNKLDQWSLGPNYPDRIGKDPIVELQGLVCQKKSFSPPSPLVLSYLSNSSENEILNDATTDWIPLSRCFVDRKSNVAKSRTLVFMCPSQDRSRNVNHVVGCDIQVKLVMTENINDGSVEGKFIYGCRYEADSSDLTSLQTFENSSAADLFASQFCSLMLLEGYHLTSDETETIPPSNNGGSMIREPYVISSANVATGGILDWPSPPLVPRLQTYTSRAISKDVSAPSLRESLLKTVREGQPGPLGTGQTSSQQSKLQLGNVTNAGHSHLQQQQILNSRMHLEHRVQQILNQRHELGKRNTRLDCAKAPFGGLGVTQLVGRMQLPQDVNVGYLSNLAGMPQLQDVGPSNSLVSNVSIVNGRKYLPALVASGHQAADLAKMRKDNLLRRAPHTGVFSPGTSSVLPMQMPDKGRSGVEYCSLQEQQLELYRQLPQLSQRELGMKSSPVNVGLGMHGNSYPGEVSSKQTVQQAQLSLLQQLRSGPNVFQQMYTGKTVLGPETSEIGSSSQRASVGGKGSSLTDSFLFGRNASGYKSRGI